MSEVLKDRTGSAPGYEVVESDTGILIASDTSPKPVHLSAVERYRRDHCRCPNCGRNEFESNCVGYAPQAYTDPKFIDKHEVECVACGWRGIEHHKIGLPDPCELKSHEDRYFAEVSLGLLWDALHLSDGQYVLASTEVHAERRRMYEELGRRLLGYGVPEKERH